MSVKQSYILILNVSSSLPKNAQVIARLITGGRCHTEQVRRHFCKIIERRDVSSSNDGLNRPLCRLQSTTSKMETKANSDKEAAASFSASSSSDAATYPKEKDGICYHEKIILGYSREQMCHLVGHVESYKEFVPFCLNSDIIDEKKPVNRINLNQLKKTSLQSTKNLFLAKSKTRPPAQQDTSSPRSFKARLEIGYPPIREAYISNVSVVSPFLVKSISRDTQLFEFLVNEWKFHPYSAAAVGSGGGGETTTTAAGNSEKSPESSELMEKKCCIVEFYVTFKFRSPIYARFSGLFMDQIFKKMVNAFTDRALSLYGKPSIEAKKIK